MQSKRGEDPRIDGYFGFIRNLSEESARNGARGGTSEASELFLRKRAGPSIFHWDSKKSRGTNMAMLSETYSIRSGRWTHFCFWPHIRSQRFGLPTVCGFGHHTVLSRQGLRKDGIQEVQAHLSPTKVPGFAVWDLRRLAQRLQAPFPGWLAKREGTPPHI